MVRSTTTTSFSTCKVGERNNDDGKISRGCAPLRPKHHNSEYKQFMDFGPTTTKRDAQATTNANPKKTSAQMSPVMTTIRVHIYVSGRVQGVNYRRFAVREARALGITGWAMNLPDRRVEVVAEGEESAVKELIRRLREGPALAIVRDMEVHREPPTGEHESFTIRR